MSGPRVYLDHNATSPIRPEALAAMTDALAAPGNPSSVHASGRAARARVEDARAAVAALVGGAAGEIVFTSGGTEADALAIWSAAAAPDVSRLIVFALEHEAVRESARATGLPVEEMPATGDGVADLDWLRDRLSGWRPEEGRPFVALMLASHETGVIQPVADAAALVQAVGGWLHVDAVQAAGRIGLDVERLGADTLALSAHKLGGPQGAGALWASPRARLGPRLHGGGQEKGLRAGTENVAALAGFAAAARAALRDLALVASQAAWRDAAAERLKATGATVVGEGSPRLADVLCLATPGFSSSLQVMALDLEGVEVSAGAACSSGKVTAGRTLAAMGFAPDLAQGVLRVSGGWTTTGDDWDRFADVWLAARARLQAAPPVRPKEYA